MSDSLRVTISDMRSSFIIYYPCELFSLNVFWKNELWDVQSRIFLRTSISFMDSFVICFSFGLLHWFFSLHAREWSSLMHWFHVLLVIINKMNKLNLSVIQWIVDFINPSISSDLLRHCSDVSYRQSLSIGMKLCRVDRC